MARGARLRAALVPAEEEGDMKPWSVVRVAVPVSVGLCLWAIRPTWQSVAVLGLLIVVAVWLDAQERRADDVEDLEEHLNARVSGLGDRVKQLCAVDEIAE